MKMKCTRCGADTVELERVSRAFSERLPNVIVDGLERGECSVCGEVMTTYPRWSELSERVVVALLAKPSRLTADEIRFLRLKVGVKALALAETLGVTPSQVSSWENAAVPISALADRLLRMVTAAKLGLSAPELASIDGSRSEPLSLRVELTSGGWVVAELDAEAA